MNVFDEVDWGVIHKAKLDWHERQPVKAFYMSNFDFVHEGKWYGTCLRAQWYTFMGVEPLWDTINPTNFYRRHFGAYVQQFVEDMLSYRWLIHKEIKLPEIRVPELTRPIHGRVDDIIERSDSLEKIMIELKSTHGGKFTRKNFGIIYHGCPIENKYQLGLYKKYYPELMNEYHISYLSREDFNRKDFQEDLPTEFDFKWWIKLEEFLANKTLPSRKYRANADKECPDFPCKKWCDYYSVCFQVHRDLDGKE
jgi:hypothetical protein